jgi:uncharacterized protein (TIGR02611 family)
VSGAARPGDTAPERSSAREDASREPRRDEEEGAPALERAAEEEAKAKHGDVAAAGERPESGILQRFAERRESYQRRHPVVKVGVQLLGLLLVIGGVVLSGPGVPGPGFLVIALGLSLLALQFRWAERLLYRAVAYLEKSQEKAKETSTAQRVAAGLVVVLAIAGYVAAAILWEIPLLPG